MSEQLAPKPIEAVFISDLHLNPEEEALTQRFFHFLEWVETQTESLYILGDFFHVWPGDDAMDEWADEIARRLANLAIAGVKCYFMAGNRDFLLSHCFARLSRWIQLPDPTVITLGRQRIMLSHGDRYCTADKAHQWFRRLTRWVGFAWFFNRFPLSWRKKWVSQVRRYSAEHHRFKSSQQMDVVERHLLKSMQLAKVNMMIHGHTHAPQAIQYSASDSLIYKRYVLSDWDDNPVILCYYKTYGFLFNLYRGK
jgi:UDP-2,3-diacylglucosamine hydrolase